MYLNFKIVFAVSFIFLVSTIRNITSNSNSADNDWKNSESISTKKIIAAFSPTEETKLSVKKSPPITTQRFYKKHETKKIRHRTDWIFNNYKTYIKQASRLTHVSEDLITSFIFIESGGYYKSLNKKSGATGLMQLTEGACSDIIYLKNKLGGLTKAEKLIIKKTLGDRLDCILSMKHMGQKRKCNGNLGYNVMTNDLYNPEFNILCGAIYLGILIDKHTENGQMRLDKIVARYNIGLFTKIKGKTPEEVMMNGNKETKAYIKKLVGIDGLLAIINI